MSDVMIETPDGPIDEVPLFEDNAAKNEYTNYCFDVHQPAILINKIRGRTWCFVECDFVPLEGRDPIDGYNRGLIADAAEQVNAICEEFEDEDLRYQLSCGTLSTTHGASFISFPDMRPDVARRFADRIRPIIMDESNWQITHVTDDNRRPVGATNE